MGFECWDNSGAVEGDKLKLNKVVNIYHLITVE